MAALVLTAVSALAGTAGASDERTASEPAERAGVSQETRQALDDGRDALDRFMEALELEIDQLAVDGAALWRDGEREVREAVEALRERFSEPAEAEAAPEPQNT